MLAVSAGFLQAIKNKAPQDVRLEFTGGDVIGTSDIAITSGGLTYMEILNGETDVIFGRAVMSELSAVLINADSRFTNFDFSREFEAKVGVKVGGTFEYVSLGIFKGNRPDKVRGKLIDFTAHDRMSLFDKSAESFTDGLTFPCTLGEIFAKLCAFCGVGYVSAVFPNSGKTFDKNPLADTDYTCREILGYIAEAAGAYARMSRSGAVELVWFADVNYTVTRTDRFEMTESEFFTPPIDRLEVYNSYGDQLNTSGSGDIVYGISDNPFLYIENDTQLAGLQPYVDVIYNRITSLPAYHPSSFRAEFNPAVQCGDIISVVDDYGETISFPVFVQTITWNGGGKTVYENTGGVIRQNAPFTQRELEQIKKKSLRTVDLYTTIDSYLSTEEGIASITTAVGGTFVTQNDLSGYAKTTEVSTQIKQEVKDGVGNLTLESSVSTNEEIEPVGSYSGGSDFILDDDGYYVSQNKGVSSSYAYGTWAFTDISEAQTVILRCVSDGESAWDYGIISNINTFLTMDNTADATGVFHSFINEQSEVYVDLQFEIPAGSSFFTFKYIKDGSRDEHGDVFKIKVIRIVKPQTSLTSKITMRSDDVEVSSVSITFMGLVTFNSLSTSGATTINGDNIKTGLISADRIDVSTLAVEQVYFKNEHETLVLTSNKPGGSALEVNVGAQSANERTTYLNLIGEYVTMVGEKGRTYEDAEVFINISNHQVYMYGGDWGIGSTGYPLGKVFSRKYYFDDDTYLYSDGGDLCYHANGKDYVLN